MVMVKKMNISEGGGKNIVVNRNSILNSRIYIKRTPFRGYRNYIENMIGKIL